MQFHAHIIITCIVFLSEHVQGWPHDWFTSHADNREFTCPLARPCGCKWKDVEVKVWNEHRFFWTPNFTTVMRHRASCAGLGLTQKTLPDMQVTDRNKDFALFDFSGNKVRNFPDDFFDSIEELLVLNLTSNYFQRVPGAVQKCKNLIILSMSQNRLELGSKSPFRMMSRLQTLAVNHNRIRHLNADIFKGLDKLLTLRLDSNQIDLIEPGVFKDLTHLKILTLSENKLKTLSADYFRGLKDVEQLALNDNLLTEIPAAAFQNTPNLEILLLHKNKVKTLHEASFYNLLRVTHLDLGHNEIRKIPNGMFEKLNAIETLLLSRNKLVEMKHEQFIRIPNTLTALTLASNQLTITSFDEKVRDSAR